MHISIYLFFFFQAEDGIRDLTVTGVQTCALPIYDSRSADRAAAGRVRPGIRSPRLARHTARGGDSRSVAPRGVVAAGPRGATPQHLGGRAAHGVLEVHRAATADARQRAVVPPRGEQLAAASGASGRRGVAAGRRAAPRAAPAAARGDRPLPAFAPRRARVAVALVERRARLRDCVARPVSRGADPAAQAAAARVRRLTRP